MSAQVDAVSGSNLGVNELLPVGRSSGVDDLLPVKGKNDESDLLPIPQHKDQYTPASPKFAQTCTNSGLKSFFYYTQGPSIKRPQEEAEAEVCLPKSQCDYERQAATLSAEFKALLAGLNSIDSNAGISGPEEVTKAFEHYQQAMAIYQKYSDLLAEYKKIPGITSGDVVKLELDLNCDDNRLLQLKMESVCRAMRQPLMEGLQVNTQDFKISGLTHPLEYLKRVDAYVTGLQKIAEHLGYSPQAKQELEGLLAEQKMAAFRSLRHNISELKTETFKIARGIGRTRSDALKDFDEACERLEAFEMLVRAIPEAKQEVESGYFSDKVLHGASQRACPKVLEALKKYNNKTSLTIEEISDLNAHIQRAQKIKAYVSSREQAQLEHYLNLLQVPYQGEKLMASR